MARIDVTQDAVYDAILAKLRTDLDLNERNCYETLYPDAPGAPPANWFLTLSPGDSVYDEGLQEGGGAEQLTEDHEFVVTIYSKIHLDSISHDAKALHEDSRGMFALKKRVLAALAQVDLPTGEDDTFQRAYILVRRCGRPEHDPQKHVVWMSITFHISWDWDLTIS